MKLVACGLSDVGRRREKNEDALLVDPSRGLFAVADGMGGHAAGEVASRLAVETLSLALPGGADGASLESAIAEANARICEAILARDEQRGMGTTLVVLLVAGDRVLVGHVGDSRAYRCRDGRLERLTSDHSWVNEQVKMGLLSDDDAQRHPMRNIVTRALGSRADVATDLSAQGILTGDVFLLCSDGLNTMVSDSEIGQILASHGHAPEAACRVLVDAANARGGEDNITVVVVSVAEDPSD